MDARERVSRPAQARSQAPSRALSHGRPLDGAEKEYFEPRFGFDFSKVRIHNDRDAGDLARSFGTAAFTSGSDIVLGTPRPSRDLLAHELAHVVQQSRSTNTGQAISDPAGRAEREADAAAAQIAAGTRAHVGLGADALVQCAPPRLSVWDRVRAAEGRQETQPPTMDVWDRTRASKPEDEPTKAARKATLDDLMARQKAVYAAMDAVKAEAASGKALTGRRKLFANSVEWIASGAGDLVVLVPTHDADTRAPAYGRAHVDASVKYPNVGGQIPLSGVTGADQLFYEKNTAASGVAVRHPRTGRPTIFLFKPDDDPAEIEVLVTHETQHLVDRHFDELLLARARGKQRDAAREKAKKEGKEDSIPPAPVTEVYADQIALYKSEFRAFWISGETERRVVGGGTVGDPQLGSPDKPALNDQVLKNPLMKTEVKTGFTNERQEKIFWRLVEGYSFDRLYAMWSEFKKVVDGYDRPYTDNLVNSVRIEAVIDALGSCKKTMDSNAPEVGKLMRKVAALDATDRQFLADRKLSKDFWDRAAEALSPSVLQAFTAAVGATP